MRELEESATHEDRCAVLKHLAELRGHESDGMRGAHPRLQGRIAQNLKLVVDWPVVHQREGLVGSLVEREPVRRRIGAADVRGNADISADVERFDGSLAPAE